ncbi:MAG: Conserved rane protein of unknown function, partial [Frankiales bacterium]|nr:Conserved rane protein of unknown function [Frankiales bacterium]
AEVGADPGRTWGVPDALLGLLSLPTALVVTGLLLAVVDVPGGVLLVVASAVLAAGVALAARRPARQSGGLERALGFDLPRWSDVPLVAGWSLLLLLAQAGAAVVVGVLFPALQGVDADNTSEYRGAAPLTLAGLAVAAVLVAPVVEELLFRGLLLQSLALRLGFWPAAVLSSAVFGLLHTASLDAGGAALALATGVLGLGLCLLARRTGRLGPGIGVHALRNAAVVLLVASA